MRDQARGQWNAYPPQHIVKFAFGGISVMMYCPDKPISWHFVARFAEKLLELTANGWTGVYDVMLSHAETDVSIAVSLTVVAEGGQ